MEERLREVVTRGTLAAINGLPCLGAIRNVVAEAELRRADRIQYPAGAPLHALRNHGRTTRAQCTRAGFGSSRAHIASTYGGRCGTGRAPRRRVQSRSRAASGGAYGP